MNAAVTRYTRAAAPQAPAAACWPRAATAAVLQRCRPVACGVPRSIHIASIQLHHRRSRPASGQLLCLAARDGSSESDSDRDGGALMGSALNAGLLCLWAGLLGYVCVLAPNQTPTIDAFVVQKLVGLKAEDPFQVNEVFTCVWNFMGLYPLIYAALLIPAARSNRLPAWPFVSASVFLGAYALLPYMCLWTPKSPPQQLPPPESELVGWNRGVMRAAETPWLPAGLAAAAAYWLLRAASAGDDAWAGYLQLFEGSRLVHATSLDFALCTLLMPFWMYNDAQGRAWSSRDMLVPLLCLVPVVGPAIYLLLRPKAYPLGSSTSSSGSNGSSS